MNWVGVEVWNNLCEVLRYESVEVAEVYHAFISRLHERIAVGRGEIFVRLDASRE